jgi:Tfp pilus assembly PilM family ATPase
MEIPPVPDSEIRAVLRGELDHYRILPSGQSAFDYCRLPDLPERDDAHTNDPVRRILLMGAEERLVSSYRSVASSANLNIVALEPGAMAVLRALYPQIKYFKSVAMVVISTTGADIFITNMGDLQFYRRVDTGTKELENKSGASGNAVANKTGRGNLLMVPDTEDAAAPIDQTDSEGYNRQAISLLMTEVQRSIDYYTREFPDASDELQVRFVLDATDAENLFEIMKQYLRSEAELASVQDSLMMTGEVEQILSSSRNGHYLSAIGLALHGCGGDYASAPTLDLGSGDHNSTEKRIAPRIMNLSIAASIAILGTAIITALILGIQISTANQTLLLKKNELQVLTVQHQAKVAMLDRQNKLVLAIQHKDMPLRETIEFLAASVAPKASLDNLSIDSGGGIMIDGQATSPRSVADIMDTINLSPVLDPIRLNSLVRVGTDKDPLMLHFDLRTGYTRTDDGQLIVCETAAPQSNQGGH